MKRIESIAADQDQAVQFLSAKIRPIRFIRAL
jgi:hypothetical protein